jgi:hypothetical protein
MNCVIRIKSLLSVAAVASTLLAATPLVSAMEVSGVKLDDTAQVANQELKLNGAGVRYKVVFKVYVGGLYLAEKKATTAEVLASPGPKRITLVAMREINSDDLGRSFVEGLNKNSDRAEKTKIINQMQHLGEGFAMTPLLKKGDLVTIDWLPGSGTLIQVNGKKVTEVLPDVVFFNALLKIWIGDKPADGQLKHAMLGEKPEDFKRQ